MTKTKTLDETPKTLAQDEQCRRLLGIALDGELPFSARLRAARELRLELDRLIGRDTNDPAILAALSNKQGP